MSDDKSEFQYTDERFADIQMLRYRLKGFKLLTLRQKRLVYYLSQATLCGRDITFDQFGAYNLLIRKTLEAVYLYCGADIRQSEEFALLTVYLKRVWFSSGIHHHYNQTKFEPGFSETFFRRAVLSVPENKLPLTEGRTAESLLDEIAPVMFRPDVMPKRVYTDGGADLLASSACNYYRGVTQAEAENYYTALRSSATDKDAMPSYGLNTTLVKEGGAIRELTWSASGVYSEQIRHIIFWLEKALAESENAEQEKVIRLLIEYYTSGDLRVFDKYSIAWTAAKAGRIDFINGFIEVYGDPLGIKGSWEGIVHYKDLDATERTRKICENAQWFEDNSPVDPRFRKPVVRGVSANVVCAAMLGGDEYPASAIGINLPNADWIRARYGSKSVTIGNLTEAYNRAARGSGFREEFVGDANIIKMIDFYGDSCDDLHTDLHECLGHGSGRLLPGTPPNALRSYASVIEEARADLFALYFLADPKLVELGLLPNEEAYKAGYYTYLLNGLLTQSVRIPAGGRIEEAHMRNRALIARRVKERSGGAVALVRRDGKAYLEINDYTLLRRLFAELLAEIQRIKSEGDYDAARRLIEEYAVKLDTKLHEEMLRRYAAIDIAPYKGFINPVLRPVLDNQNNITDIIADYSESYTDQMLRYGREY
ncbi:MAG: dipeptidyl peptidase 3 [Prevotella sp.]|nr:dipeptidyl peptidase 3 [Prevotella sp.]